MTRKEKPTKKLKAPKRVEGKLFAGATAFVPAAERKRKEETKK